VYLAYVFQLVIVGFWVIPIICVVMSLAFGIAGAVQLRNSDNYPRVMFADDFVAVQDAWTFGQLVTCILLVFPGMAAVEWLLGERILMIVRNSGIAKIACRGTQENLY
jgi:hypothetical protein